MGSVGRGRGEEGEGGGRTKGRLWAAAWPRRRGRGRRSSGGRGLREGEAQGRREDVSQDGLACDGGARSGAEEPKPVTAASTERGKEEGWGESRNERRDDGGRTARDLVARALGRRLDRPARAAGGVERALGLDGRWAAGLGADAERFARSGSAWKARERTGCQRELVELAKARKQGERKEGGDGRDARGVPVRHACGFRKGWGWVEGRRRGRADDDDGSVGASGRVAMSSARGGRRWRQE